ncbi:MAG: hypothetical protein Q9220_001469 [cf. Caloplaca sp. 1 TL-2023]
MARAITFKKAYWFLDPNEPEQFGFMSLSLTKSTDLANCLTSPENQVQPLDIDTPDGETLYAWHVIPIVKYTANEGALVAESASSAINFTQSLAFQLLSGDPNSRLVINFHGNAGTVTQGWRTDTYRSLSSGASDKIHVLALDYRGFGYSTGAPDEQGLITDGIAAVQWAMNVANIPSQRIVLVGQSLGTAVATAVAEHFVRESRIEFAGIVLVAAFSDMATLLLTYTVKGVIPILSPLRSYPALQRFYSGYLKETWHTSSRLECLVRRSRKLNLHLIHSKDDFEIHWKHAESLFHTAANATTPTGMSTKHIDGVKFRQDLGNGGYTESWNAGGLKKISKQIVRYGAYSIIVGGSSLSKAKNADNAAAKVVPTSHSMLYPIQVDIEDDDSIKRALEEVQSKVGKLDALTIGAGMCGKPLTRSSMSFD